MTIRDIITYLEELEPRIEAQMVWEEDLRRVRSAFEDIQINLTDVSNAVDELGSVLEGIDLF